MKLCECLYHFFLVEHYLLLFAGPAELATVSSCPLVVAEAVVPEGCEGLALPGVGGGEGRRAVCVWGCFCPSLFTHHSLSRPSFVQPACKWPSA